MTEMSDLLQNQILSWTWQWLDWPKNIMSHLVWKGNRKKHEGYKSEEKPTVRCFLILCAELYSTLIEATWALRQDRPRVAPPAVHSFSQPQFPPVLPSKGGKLCLSHVRLLYKASSTVHAHKESLKYGNYYNYIYNLKNPKFCPDVGIRAMNFLLISQCLSWQLGIPYISCNKYLT